MTWRMMGYGGDIQGCEKHSPWEVPGGGLFCSRISNRGLIVSINTNSVIKCLILYHLFISM